MKHTAVPSRSRTRPVLYTFCLLALVFIGLYQIGIQPAAAYNPTHKQNLAPDAAYQVLPAVSFELANQTVSESIGTFNVEVQISQAPTDTATVRYMAFSGTADSSDYSVGGTGTLTFPANSTTSQNISVQITPDTLSEPDETFRLFLYDPVNVRIVTPDTTIITIDDNDPVPTATPTGGAPIFADALEPNNNFDEASNVDAGGAARCALTFYPPGDEDFFRWWGQAGISYRVFTRDLAAGLDTDLRVYNTNQNLIAQNDDETPGSRNSSVEFTASTDGYYYARVINTIPGDPINKTYCFEVSRFLEPTLTPPPGFPPGADACEFNSTFEYACLAVVNETFSLNFIPTLGSEQDTDMFRLWVKPGIYYTCETSIPAGSAADTNIILFDGNGNPFSPWIGNDDKEQGDLGSIVSYLATYTGWLFIEVGPVNVPPYEEASQHTYTLTCTQLVATPTPTATNTPPPLPTSPGGGGGTFFTPTPIPTIAYPTPLPTPTPINPADFIPTPVPPPLIDVQPLPTATPMSGGQFISVDVTIFYDSNFNYLPEQTEGVLGVDVALFDNATGDLLSYGQTNEAGMIHFEVQAAGTVRIIVPFLSYSQIITQSTDEVLIRIAPGTLPIGIP